MPQPVAKCTCVETGRWLLSFKRIHAVCVCDLQTGVNHLQHVVGDDGRVSHYHTADREYEAGDEVWASYDMEQVGFKKCNHGA